MSQFVDLEIDRLLRLNKPLPRYTSYPTAPEWGPLTSGDYLSRLTKASDPLSLYLHIPFCQTMCLFCACSVILNRQVEVETRYVETLCREMELVAEAMGPKRRLSQLHFGGGTPTKLSIELLRQIVDRIESLFEIDPDGEIAIEIDPRTVVEDGGAKLRQLRDLGFNRVSFGVQDTDPKVQEAIRRRQSYAATRTTYELARELGFSGINVDLIYGLPLQTLASFTDTVEKICEMAPDRIALFSWAQVPWLKPHQKAIREEQLPSTEEKFRIYAMARRSFVESGYVAIGMDHFALPGDSITAAFQTQKLQRNFQGYSLQLARDLIGCGVTATGFVDDGYFQNEKELKTYSERIDRGELPILRGKLLTEDDKIRKWTIHRLMCDFSLDKRQFEAQFATSFDTYFSRELLELRQLEREGLVTLSDNQIEPSSYGSLFIRNLASCFDGYLHRKSTERRFSQSI